MVSVIIVTFNAERFIENAILSVLNQSYKNIELLIVDGNSTDGTISIIKKYNDKLNYISEPDKGIYDAMNKGWKLATYDWILYLGADDILEPDVIESLIISLLDDNDVVYGNTYLRFANGKTKSQFAKKLDHMNKTFITCHQSVIMKKEVIKKLGGFDLKYKLLADYDLLLRAYLNGFKFAKSNSFISTFSINGTSEKNINKLVMERHKILVTNKSVSIPWIYTIYFFIKQNLAKVKHITINNYL